MCATKKKLLFVMDTFPLGGISKSLLALFAELGEEYSIDFLLMKQEGLFLPLIPKHVRLLPEPIGEEYRNPHPKFIFTYLFNLPFARFCKWFCFSLACTWARLHGGLHKMVQVMDVAYAKAAAPQSKQYDAAIAYQGGRCIYYIVERVQATCKIGYVHSDYTRSETDHMLKPTDSIYFPHLDCIATISDTCVESLNNEFPILSERIRKIENICSPTSIREQADTSVEFDCHFNGIRLISMGRLDIQTKGIDMALKACQFLKQQGVAFRWYWLGDGQERAELERMILAENVGDCFILLGAKINPYPYIKQADIYVQPSRYEGKSVALDEVKALAKPCVVTHFTTVRDQFEDSVTALIADMTPESIAEKILKLIASPELRESLSNNLEKTKVDNREQLKVFTSLFEH